MVWWEGHKMRERGRKVVWCREGYWMGGDVVWWKGYVVWWEGYGMGEGMWCGGKGMGWGECGLVERE